MNKRHFEIYQRYRKRKYERDLDRLQTNLEQRGLIRSGLRNKEEKWLKEDYEDEVAMQKEESLAYEEERASIYEERKNQIRTNRILAGVAVITLVLVTPFTVYLGLTQPDRDRKADSEQSIKNQTTLLYRTIVANEDIFIENINNLREFSDATTSQLLYFPNNYIYEDLNLEIQDELQNQIGLVNYKLLLYYIDQTNLLNKTISDMRESLRNEGFESEKFVVNKKFYHDLMSYLNQESWENTKFNYQMDTGCLLKILQEAFPFIRDERNSQIECGTDSLNRIYYYFGYYEVDTPSWMKPKLKDALGERGIDAWWIQ